MPDVVIRAEGLGKKYVIGHRAESSRYVALRDVLTQNARALWNTTKDLAKGKPIIGGDRLEEVWALKDVSLEICRGEAVAIIGRNGAGKSTLLKILSRITEPSTGRVTIKGRVASLLEVGTGFHPELTGRENISLNGSILGMTRKEIASKFDEIVAFAEVETYLDTPVKRYSSGMYVRLAFAVAAHLEPEILLVDEVLAVGDAAFQRKCLGKMGDVAHEGRTVLFVSHNMAAVKQLCQTGIWIHNGSVQQTGSVDDVAHAYGRSVPSMANAGDFAASRVQGDGQVELVSYRVTNADGEASPPPGTCEDLLIHIALRVTKTIGQPAFGISIYNEFGVLMTSLNTVEQGATLPPLPAGEVTVCVRVKRISFLPGHYTASFWVMSPQAHIYVLTESSIAFEIAQVPLYGTRQVDYRWGCVYSDIQFGFGAASTTTREHR
jgi:lipopolysaccharide transport system ATP-binding protein